MDLVQMTESVWDEPARRKSRDAFIATLQEGGNMEQMDQQEEERGLRAAFGAIGLLRRHLDNNPHLAKFMAIELEQTYQRFERDPSPDLELRVRIPLTIMQKWLNQFDLDRAEKLLLQAMQDEIERAKE